MNNDGFVVNLRLFNKNNNIFLQIICRNTKNVVPLRTNNKNTTERIMKNKPILTEEQQALATAKEKISEALQEINNELKTISGYLPQVGKQQKLEFIHELANVQDQLANYLTKAETELNNYSTTRKRLISFADKEDIFFIPRLITNTLYDTRTVVSVLKKCQEEVFVHPNETSELVAEEIISLHVFFKGYVKTLEKMWHVYENLYDAVYACDTKEREKRLDIQYRSYIANKSKHVNNDESLAQQVWGTLAQIEDDEFISFFEGFSTNECFYIDKNSVNITSNRVTFTTRKVIEISKIREMQDYIGQCMQKIVPDISKNEFTKKAELANYIHEHKLEHHQTNILIAGYYRLHWLEQINDIIAQQTASHARPGRKVYEFSSDFDCKMLSRVFVNTYEVEKYNINAQSKNIFAGLFLIAMHKMNPYNVIGKVKSFCNMIWKYCGFNLCAKSIQNLIAECNKFLYGKITNEVSLDRLKRYMGIAERLMPQLEKMNLIIA